MLTASATSLPSSIPSALIPSSGSSTSVPVHTAAGELSRLEVPPASLEAQPASLEALVAFLTQQNAENTKKIQELTEKLSTLPSYHKPPHAPGTLRLLSALPLGKAISPKHVAGFISESGMLHPLMEIMHTASVLTLFTVQFVHSLKQLAQTRINNKDRVFHIKMAIVSACIVLEKLAELTGLHTSSHLQELFMLGIVIPLAAYYSDAPLEMYIEKYLYIPQASHDKNQ